MTKAIIFEPISESEMRVLNGIDLCESALAGICMSEVTPWLDKYDAKDASWRNATVFAAMKALERRKLIAAVGKSRAARGGRPRRLFRPTPLGAALLQIARQMENA